MILAALVLIINGVGPADAAPMPIASAPASFGYALVYALLAFGGWSEVATLSAEVQDARRGMARALISAILIITALYLAVNWAFWYGLGMEALGRSSAPAAELMDKAFGPWAGIATALAIAFAVITSINATIVVGARTTYACAHDWPALKRIGVWDERRQIPAQAIWAQGALSLALVVFGAFYDGFVTLVDYTAPVYWLFLTMSGIAVIVLRVRQSAAARPFKVPLYPALPLMFAASSLAMLISSLQYVTAESGAGALVSVAVLALGLVALVITQVAGRTAS
jgi:amino acid transporter